MSLDNTVYQAVRAASETLVQPAAISIIRNGGWEGAFRNHIMLALEKQNPRLLGFTEGSDRKAVRVDLMLWCTECKELVFGIETKINFYTQKTQEIIKQLEDGFAKASRLAELTPPRRVFLVHAIADLWSVNMDQRAYWHNSVVTERSYKRFLDHDPTSDRASDQQLSPNSIRRWILDNEEWKKCQEVCIHPEESTLSVPEVIQATSVTRLRVWIAQVSREGKEQFHLKFLRNDAAHNGAASLSRTELEEIRCRNDRRQGKQIRWSATRPRNRPTKTKT